MAEPLTLRDRLERVAEVLPPGAQVILPVDWLREQLVPGRDGGDGVLEDLTIDAIAKALDRSPNTVRRWCASGRIRGAYRLGREWRVPRASLQSLRESGEPESEPRTRNVDIGAWRKVKGDER